MVRCPHCETARRRRRTALGYRTFSCQNCGRSFNERTGTPFNHLQYPTDIVRLAVLWRLRYKLSFRDVAELLLDRGFQVTHETVRSWEFRFAPLLADELRSLRRGRAGVSWYLDETYVKVGVRSRTDESATLRSLRSPIAVEQLILTAQQCVQLSGVHALYELLELAIVSPVVRVKATVSPLARVLTHKLSEVVAKLTPLLVHHIQYASDSRMGGTSPPR